MTIGTLAKFLIGDRRAILQVGSDPRGLWIGLLFVLSAGLAREYDKESLLHEPYHLLLPPAASLLTATALFLFLIPPLWRMRSRLPALPVSYRAFLQAFWMTAPLAWLYAVPWEYFTSAFAATQFNLWTLGIVSVWRVLLITRVLSVLFGLAYWKPFFLVMTYASSAAIIAVWMLPFPVIAVMGGIQLSESEQLVAEVGRFVIVSGVFSLPFWAVGALVALFFMRPQWMPPDRSTAIRFGSLERLAWGSLLLGLALLPLTQPQQMRRHHAERLLAEGSPARAIAYMASCRPGDFPPHWDPPPRPFYGHDRPPISEVVEALFEVPGDSWVHRHYAEKYRRVLRNRRLTPAQIDNLLAMDRRGLLDLDSERDSLHGLRARLLEDAAPDATE